MTEKSKSENRQKHIAMYISSLQKGGAERVMVNLAEYFYSQGYKVTFVTTYIADVEYEVKDAAWKRCSDNSGKKVVTALNHSEKPVYVDLLGGKEDGIQRVFSGLLKEEQTGRISNFSKRMDKLTQIWMSIKPDLILSFIGKNNVMALMTAGQLHIPVVVSCRANPRMEYEQRGTRYAAMMLYRKAAGVVLQTNGAKDYFPKAVQKKVTLLPNSLNPEFMRPRFDGDREKTIVMVGRIDDNKNHAMVLRAFAQADKKYPGFKVKFYGDGPSAKKVRKLAEELTIEDLVSFEGVVPNVADRIQSAGIFVLASDEEGMPNALMEAMSLGLPCISTDCPCGGPADLIRDGHNGLLVPVGDQEAMTKALEKLMSNRRFGEDLGKRAMQIQKDYAPDKINAKWKAYLDSFMK